MFAGYSAATRAASARLARRTAQATAHAGRDAAGLSLFCVTGAATALTHRLGTAEAIILGAITGIDGGMVRDIVVREIPVVLRTGL